MPGTVVLVFCRLRVSSVSVELTAPLWFTSPGRTLKLKAKSPPAVPSPEPYVSAPFDHSPSNASPVPTDVIVSGSWSSSLSGRSEEGSVQVAVKVAAS